MTTSGVAARLGQNDVCAVRAVRHIRRFGVLRARCSAVIADGKRSSRWKRER